MPDGRYWLETLGCPKNQVDSDKLAGLLAADGYVAARAPAEADLVVVNTCAFIEAARQESVDTVLSLAEARRPGARLVVTGCMAERYGDELARALPEVDLVAGFGRALVGDSAPAAAPPPGAPVALGRRRPASAASFDLLSLPRPASKAPWAYVKVAEGCDRICGFCAIPSFRGPQRSRPEAQILAEVEALASDPAMPVREVVLVAQDLASYDLDRGAGDRGARTGPTPLVRLVRAVAGLVERVRLLYLYPSSLSDELIETIAGTGVPYYDLSLQHVSRPLVRSMRRYGDAERFLDRIGAIRRAAPGAALRSSFILGYPGETEADHDLLLEFLEAAELDWGGFFAFSAEEGTHAAGLGEQVPAPLAMERLRECAELQDAITARRRDALVGEVHQVLVDAPGRGRTALEAPEIDGVVRLPRTLPVGALLDVRLTASLGTDMEGEPAADAVRAEPALAGGGRP